MERGECWKWLLHLRSNRFEWEVLAWAEGVVRMDQCVSRDATRRDVVFVGQPIQKSDNALHLFRGWLAILKIANQANPYGIRIQLVGDQVPTSNLPRPPVTDMNLTIPHAIAVANQKMIGQTVGHATRKPMEAVETRNGT